jgi:hypothetical protein
MNFDGLLDLTNKENKYDFLCVENADLNQLNLVKDSVSILGRCCAGFRKFH